MKSLHRCKAIDTYKAARISLKENLVYSSYMLLKESTRSALAYINEDIQGKEYSEKTKMRKLLDDVPTQLTQDVNLDMFNIFVEMDNAGLEGIFSIDINVLKDIKKALKKIIGIYLDEKV